MIVFFFTDIEGSTRLWERYRQDMVPVIQRHDTIIYGTITRYGGRVIEHTGDGVYAIFENGEPLVAALEIQQQIATVDWHPVEEVRIRMGLDGRSQERLGIDYFPKGEGYFGPVVNSTFRIMSAGWGGQILLGQQIVEGAELPPGATVQDMGLHMLRSMVEPQRIYSLSHPDLPQRDFPPLRTRTAYARNLPEPASPFVDRDEERALLHRLLTQADCRLISLIGPGGIGKSRLSIQAAQENLQSFQNGVCFVSLAAVQSPEYLVPTIADALNLPFYNREDTKKQLFDYLQEKEMLLVMDNLEHISTSSAVLLTEILQAAPRTKVLATSRARLNLRQEWTVEVRGMAVPEESPGRQETNPRDYPAVMLFLQAAQRVRPEFAPTDEDITYIVEICRKLQGMPLAIELAAAWTRLLTCRGIAEELEQNPHFFLNSSRGRDNVPERHQSLRAVFEYSWELLSDTERGAMARLSVFRGGFHRKAAEHVAGTSLFMLSALLDQSLIRESEEPGRYEIHTLLRQYAAEKLANQAEATTETQTNHARYFLSFIQGQHSRLTGNEQETALQEILSEIENVRAAWAWALAQGLEMELYEAFDTLLLFYVISSRFPELELLFRDVPVENLSPRLQALVEIGLAVADYNVGRYADTLLHLNNAKPFTNEQDVTLLNLLFHYYQGGAYLSLGQYKRAHKALQTGLELGMETNNLFHTAGILTSLGVLYRVTGDYVAARNTHKKALAISRVLGNEWLIGLSVYMLGYLAFVQRELEEAEHRLQEGLTIHERVGDYRAVAFASNLLGNIARERGGYEKAYHLHQQALTLFQSIADQRGIAYSYLFLGQVLLEQGKIKEARQALCQALQVASKIETTPLTLQVLLVMSRILQAQGEAELVAELLILIYTHPATDDDTRKKAADLMPEGRLTSESIHAPPVDPLPAVIRAMLNLCQSELS